MQGVQNKRAAQMGANSRSILVIDNLWGDVKVACIFCGYETTGGEILGRHIWKKIKTPFCLPPSPVYSTDSQNPSIGASPDWPSCGGISLSGLSGVKNCFYLLNYARPPWFPPDFSSSARNPSYHIRRGISNM